MPLWLLGSNDHPNKQKKEETHYAQAFAPGSDRWGEPGAVWRP